MFERIAKFFRRRRAADLEQFKMLFEKFQHILTGNNHILELISELDDKLGGEYIFDINYLKSIVRQLSDDAYLITSNLNVICDNRFPELFNRQAAIADELQRILEEIPVLAADDYAVDYANIDSDTTEFIGAKNARLGEIRNHLKMLTPDGFALTTQAYRRFMEFNELWPKIRDLYAAYEAGKIETAIQYDRSIDELFARAAMPPDVEKSTTRYLNALYKRHKDRFGLAVRSSACGEDTQGQSFAGQFKTYLNCRRDDVSAACIKVIASRFKHAVSVYHGEQTLNEDQLPMAIGIQQMIPSLSAGVAYSVSTSERSINHLVITSCFGLGSAVVGGTGGADRFCVSRLDPSQIVNRSLGAKKTIITVSESGGVKTVPLPKNMQERPSLSDAQVIDLAEKVLLLDRYFKRPVDVEWCFDEQGKLIILQCRPLKLPPKPLARPVSLSDALTLWPIIMRGKGQVAQRGIAAGKVWQVKENDDPDIFPVGAIAVTKYTTPRLTSIIRRCAAIITDVGSASGHMATVAREFMVPMIVNTTDATKCLDTGAEVTVDAEENIIYRGIVEELLEYEMEGEDVFRDLKEYRILRHLLRWISPLNLIDPKSPNFTARNCRTYHDIARFCHEKAVQLLINLNMSSRRFRGIKSRKLKLSIPLGLSVIDLGGGLTPSGIKDEIESFEMVQSIPMRAILNGLTSPGVWSTEPMQLGFSDLVSSLTRYSMTDRVAEYEGQNLAVISDRYVNLSLRLGYHFNVISAYISENVNDNYIYFRFVGGVTETDRRHRRAILIKNILEKLNFRVTVNGDLIVAGLKKWVAEEMVGILEEIGRLIGFSRQLDTQMQSEESIEECFRAFFQERNDLK